MTEKGKQLISDFHDRFRDDYLNRWADASESEIERSFLSLIACNLSTTGSLSQDDRKRIEEIE